MAPKRFRGEQCRPNRRFARPINVRERTDGPWGLPTEVMCGVQREKMGCSGRPGCILWPCQGQNENPGYEEFADGVWFPVTYGGEFKIKALFIYKRTIALSMVNTGFQRTEVTGSVEFAEEAASNR